MSTERDKKTPASAPRASDKRKKRSQPEILERQHEIVLLHDVNRLTFREIAQQIGMNEKSVREAYHRYVCDVAPVLNTLANHDKVAAHLRLLEEVSQRLWLVAATADNSSATVGALRTIVEIAKTDIQLRQNLGLLPKAPRSMADEQEKAWVGQQVAQLLYEIGAPAEALDELERILSGEAAPPGE